MTRSIKNLIAAVLIAISSYLVWVEILPAYTVTTFLKEKIVEKEALVASREEIIKKIESLREESISKYNELQRLALLIPGEKGYSEIISAIEKIYGISGVTIPELTVSQEESSAAKNEPVQKISFKTTNKGTYSQFLNILAYLEKNIRLFDVNKIEIGLGDEEANINPNLLNNPQLMFNIGGQSYWLKPAVTATKTGTYVPKEEEI